MLHTFYPEGVSYIRVRQKNCERWRENWMDGSVSILQGESQKINNKIKHLKAKIWTRNFHSKCHSETYYNRLLWDLKPHTLVVILYKTLPLCPLTLTVVTGRWRLGCYWWRRLQLALLCSTYHTYTPLIFMIICIVWAPVNWYCQFTVLWKVWRIDGVWGRGVAVVGSSASRAKVLFSRSFGRAPLRKGKVTSR
jgi:hypothetical protein